MIRLLTLSDRCTPSRLRSRRSVPWSTRPESWTWTTRTSVSARTTTRSRSGIAFSIVPREPRALVTRSPNSNPVDVKGFHPVSSSG